MDLIKDTVADAGYAYTFNRESGIFEKTYDDALNEVVLLFTGQLTFADEKTKKDLSVMEDLFGSADLVCTPFTEAGGGGFFARHRGNANIAGSLAEAFGAGCSLLYTSGHVEEKVKELLAPGQFLLDEAGSECMIRVNGLTAAFLTGTGHAAERIGRARQRGADFIVVLTDRFQKDIKENARRLANDGADLIVMTCDEIKQNHFVTADDGRNVPYVGGLGQMFSPHRNAESAAVKVRLIKTFTGEITLEPCYIPIQQRKTFKETVNAAVPAHRAYNRRFMDQSMRAARKSIREKIGPAIRIDSTESVIRNKSGFKPQISIRKICEILGIDAAAYDGKYPVDEKVHSVVIREPELAKDCVVIVPSPARKVKKAITAEQAIKADAILAITDEKIEGIPCLLVDDPVAAYIKIVTYIREQYHPLTVAVTGTIGKSTTTDMIKTVMKYGYKTLDVRGNYNTYRGIGLCVQKLDDSYGAYVQEVHGGQTGAASMNSKIVEPDMCVVTFVGAAHLSQIRGGTVYDVLREKLSIIDGLKEGGTLFINNDNEYLRDSSPAVNTVRYAANNKDSDYYAENIVDHHDHITFTIVCDEGRFDALLNCGGTYNVSNAVCAFAVGRKAGIAPERILAGLSRYRTEGYRQNVVRMNGCIMTFDCDSTTPDSMKSALYSFAGTKKEGGGRYIAVLGDTAMLGKKKESWHRQYGQWIGELGYDAVLTLGPGSLFTCEEAAKAGVEVYGYLDRSEFEEKIRSFIKPGDHVLFKSSPKGGADLIPTLERLYGKLR